MAKFLDGDMYASFGTILFGTGSKLTPDGELIMDQNIKERINRSGRNFEKIFGKILKDTNREMKLFGLILCGEYGVFQTGYEPDGLDMRLFRFSMSRVSEEAIKHWFQRYNLDLHSIGNGNGESEEVIRIVEMLPDNVLVWSRKDNQEGPTNGLHTGVK